MPSHTLKPIFSVSLHLPPTTRLATPTYFKIPFYKLKSHTLPLKWQLYRFLLRFAPNEDHSEAVRRRWRKYKTLTSPRAAMQNIVEEEKCLYAYMACDLSQKKKPYQKEQQALPSHYTHKNNFHDVDQVIAQQEEAIAQHKRRASIEAAGLANYVSPTVSFQDRSNSGSDS